MGGKNVVAYGRLCLTLLGYDLDKGLDQIINQLFLFLSRSKFK